ncbi:MAG: hypothetical protein ACK5QC_02380 [Bacteroidota bacterium]|jgi:hypothetical protein
MNIKLKLLFLFVLFGIVGYFREFFFVQLNVILYQKYYNQINEGVSIASIMQPFNQLSYSTLYYSKYIFTIASVSLFYGLNYIALYTLNYKKNLKFLNFCYLLLLTLASASMLYGYLINNRLQDNEYTFSRWLLGIAQSPIVFILLVAANELNNTLNKKTEL